MPDVLKLAVAGVIALAALIFGFTGKAKAAHSIGLGKAPAGSTTGIYPPSGTDGPP